MSTVAPGLAVDNTIHFLSACRAKQAQGVPIAQTVEDLLLSKGRAVISSSLILCIGFGVLVLANFVPLMMFGILSSVIMLIDIVLDLFLIPSLLLLRTGE